MHPKSIIRMLSWITMIMALFMIVPTLYSVICGEWEAVKAFLMTLIPMAVLSVSGTYATRSEDGLKVSLKDSHIFVTLVWIVLSFFGALPLYFSGTLDSFSACFFESISGLTTTGAAILGEGDGVMRGILFWRSMTNWLGGMGIVLLFIAILPSFGVSAASLYGAEIVGPTKDKLRPKTKETAMVFWGIYSALSLAQAIALRLVGLDWFDAISVMFATMGASGYALHGSSVAWYGSPQVDIICTVFMFLTAVNFSLFYYLMTRRFDKVIGNGEFRIYVGIVLTSTLLITLNLVSNGVYTFTEALHHASFQVVSFASTTGFISTDYSLWPGFSQSVLLILSFIGGCAGSTAGGIKVVRIGVMMKLFRNSIIKRLHPNSVTTVRLADSRFTPETVQTIAAFVGFYLVNILLGTLVLSLADVDMMVAFSSALLCLGNLGVGFGGIGTSLTFAIYPNWALWFMSFLMIAGRLELFTVYALFTRSFWRR